MVLSSKEERQKKLHISFLLMNTKKLVVYVNFVLYLQTILSKKSLLALETETFGIGNRGQGKSTIIN